MYVCMYVCMYVLTTITSAQLSIMTKDEVHWKCPYTDSTEQGWNNMRPRLNKTERKDVKQKVYIRAASYIGSESNSVELGLR